MSDEAYIFRGVAPRRVRRGSSAAALLPRGGSTAAVRVLLLMALMVLAGVVGLLWSSPAYAEGSKELSSQGGDRAYLEYRPGAALGSIARQTDIKVYAQAGQTINLGSSAHGVGNGTINYTRPDGSTGTCADPRPNNGRAGLIQTRAQEAAGPTPNTGGYTPCIVTVGTGQTGVWKVEFTSPASTDTANPPPLGATANWAQPDTVSYISAWDVTVRSSAGTYVPGRVYANHLALNMGSNSRSFTPNVYVQARSGYRFRLDPNGLDPFVFIFFANNKGFRDSSGSPIYRSVQLSTTDVLPSGTTLHDPSSADTTSDVTHKLFFNSPNADLPASATIAGGSTWLVNTPTAPPNISDFTFTGSEGTTNQAAPGQGGAFHFTSDAAGPYKIFLDISGDGTYGNANDRLLVGAAQSGQNTVSWDGKDGNGTVVPVGSGSIRANVTAYAGEIHFPILDAENNPNGTKIERLNPSSQYTIHYDDTGLTGSGTAPSPLDARAGLSSQNGAQAFSGAWGDHKGVDAWSFGTGSSIALQNNIEIKNADLAVTKTDNRTIVGAGDAIAYEIKVTNNGPSAVSGATLTDAIPTGVSSVTWNCQITTGTGSCGTTNGSSGDVQTSLDLANGAVATITVNGTVTNAAAATLSNTANVARPNDVSDPNAANNSATDNTSTNRAPVPQNDTATTSEETQAVIDVRPNDSDPDAGQTLTITNVGSPGNGTAQLITSGADSGKIRYTPNADFGGTDSFTYTLCDDGSPQRCTQATVTVTVNAVNDKPVVDLNGGGAGLGFSATFVEDGAPVAIVGANALSVTDVDDANVERATVTLTNRPDGNAESLAVDTTGTTVNALYTPATGVLSLTGSATKADYQKVLRTARYENTSQSPSLADRSITFTINDGDADSDVATSTVSVSASNDRPVVDLNGGGNGIDYSTTFTEDGGPVAAVNDAALSVTDVDDANVEGARVTLTNRPDGGAEGLLVDTTGTSIDATYTPANGELVLSGSATKADYQKVLRTVRYRNDAQMPSGVDRVVEFTVEDGDLTSSVARSTIAVAAVNDAPVNAVPGAMTIDEDAPLVFSGANKLSVSDVDAGTNVVEVTLEATNGTFTMDSAAGLTFSMGDGTGDVKAVFRGTIENINAALGGLSYAPAADYNGSAVLSITTDDLGNAGTGGPKTDTDTVAITVSPVNDRPAISAVSDTTIPEDGATGPIPFTVSDVETPAGNLVVSVASDNQNLVPDANIQVQCTGGNCTITVTPEPNRFGSATITLTVTDAAGATRTETFVVTVEPTNDAPEANDDGYSTPEDTTLTVGAAGGVLSNDTDTEGSNLTVELISGPQNGTLDLEDDGSFTYVPAPNQNGDVTFTYRVRDAGGSVSEPATVTISIGAVNDAPDARDDDVQTDEDQALTFDPRGNDVDVESDGLTITVLSAPQHGTVTKNADGTLRYVPDADYDGPDEFTYTVSDGNGGTDTATVGVAVKAVNDAPVAEDDTATTDEDRSVVIDVLANDRDVDGKSNLDPASVRVVSDPVNGTTSVDGQTGEITYNPNADFNGTDEFTYEVCDRNDPPACSNPARVTVTISSVNDAPTATDRAFDAVEDTTLTISEADGVLRDASDADGDPLVAELVTNIPASAGELTLDPDGSFEFVPASDFNGEVTFSFRACDDATPQACSEIRTVTLRVAPSNDAPQAQDKNVATPEDAERKITLTATDADGDGVTFRVLQGSGPAHGSLGAIGAVDCVGTSPRTCTAEVTYTPNPNYGGADSFEYVADDGDAESVPASVDIDVTSVNDAPVADEDAYSTPEDTTLTVNAADGVLMKGDDDADGDALTAELVSGPGSGALDLDPDGSFTYDPATNFVGDVTFTYRALDGKGGVSEPATVTISVGTQNDPPAIDLNGAATGTGDAVSFVEDGGPVAIDGGSDVSVADPDDANMERATVRIDNLLDASKEFLSAEAGETGIEVSYDAASGVLFLTGSASKARYEDVLSSVRYENTSQNPSTADRRIEFVVNDGEAGSNVATSVVSVAARNDAPDADADSAATDEDTPVSVNVLDGDTDADGDDLTVTVEEANRPANGSVEVNANGTVIYTPNAKFNGEDTFTYTVSDGHGGTDKATVTITVKPINDTPIADADAYETTEDISLTVPASEGVLLGDTDADNDTLSAEVLEGPANGALTLDANGSFTYKPNENFSGTDTFRYTVRDGNGASDSATVTITVKPVNDAPDAVADSAATDEDASVQIDVLDNDTDVERDALTITEFTQGANGSVSRGPDGTLVYEPNADFNGEDTFTYTITDGESGESATVTVTVRALNDRPDSEPDSYTTDEDTPLTVSTANGVLTNDTDVENGSNITAAVVDEPANGSLTLNPDGSFEYTPNANFAGEDSFTYKASDDDLEGNITTVKIVVKPINDAPKADADSYTIDEDGKLTVATGANGVLRNDADADADELTVEVEDGPTNGTLSLNSVGSFVYEPRANYNGTDTFTYTVSDGHGGTATATVTINVAPVGDAPVGEADAYETDEDSTLSVTGANGVLKNDTDADGQTLSVKRAITEPAHGTLVLDDDGAFEYVPDAGYNGSDSFRYEVCDAENVCAAPVTVAITVKAVNDVPVGVDDSYNMGPGAQLVVGVQNGLLGNDTDADGDELIAKLVQGPAANKGTLTLNDDGSFRFVPASGFSGAVTFTYEVCENANVCSGQATVTINVASSNAAPTVRDDSASTGEAAAVSNAYVSQYASSKASTPTRLYQFETTQTPYTLAKVGSDIARPMNAIGYRSTDHSLYGYRLTKSPGVLKIDPVTGAARYLGVPRGLPTGKYIAGDVSPDGSTFYLYAAKAKVLWKVDLATFRATKIKLSAAMNISDLAVSPTNNKLYTVDQTGRMLQIDPQTGQVTAKTVTNLKAGGYGAIWFTSAGDLIVYENGTPETGGTLVWITRPTTTPSVISTKAGPYTKGNDGAAYVAAPNLAGLSVVVDVLANDGDPDGVLDRNSLRIVQQPEHGTVSTNADKAITYTSGSSYSGTDSFRYEVCDNGSPRQCGTATVAITSDPVTGPTGLTASRKE